MKDFAVTDHGSIAIVKPISTEAANWIQANVGGTQDWWCGGLVVEPRYLEALVDGMLADGLVLA